MNTVRRLLGAVALVVDSDQQACRMLSRVLGGVFEAVLTATTPEEAEAILKKAMITHLVCDHELGIEEHGGFEYAAQWRRTYPSIRRVVVIAGTDISQVRIPVEIDLILTKSVTSNELRKGIAI